MQRTHRLREDRRWLPGPVRRHGWVVSGAIWGGGVAAVAAAAVAAPAVLLFWQSLAIGGIGVGVLGQRAGRLAFQHKMAQLTRGELPLADVGTRDEGELVCVRGRIEATTTLQGVLHATPGVYRRLLFAPAGRWVHEAAVDFALVDDRNTRILVQSSGARWLVPPREPLAYPIDRFAGEDLPRAMRAVLQAARVPTILAAEQVLEVGARVQIVGYKTVSPDVDGEVVDYRSPPQRATLRSGPDLPLVITRVDDLA